MKIAFLAATTLALAVSASVHANDDKRIASSQQMSYSDAALEDVTTQTFFHKAAMNGMAEVELGRLAAAQGGSSAVREYGQQMVADHGKANAELKALAGKHDVQLPTSLDADHRAVQDRLQGLNGMAFDRSFADVMANNHGQAIALFESGADLDDAEVAQFATDKLPTLRLHATHAQRLQTSQ